MRQGNRSGWSSEFFKHPVGCLRSPSFLQVLNIYRRQRYGRFSLFASLCAPPSQRDVHTPASVRLRRRAYPRAAAPLAMSRCPLMRSSL